ncbi:Retrovirus-related Pol polyprotein from transposon 17.6, partial [Mucuna pruriens]
MTHQAPSRVYDPSFDACLESLSRVLDRCIKTNLVLNFEKCHFMVTEGIVLGNLVLRLIRPKLILFLLFLTSYLCRRFVLSLDMQVFTKGSSKNFSKIALPLSKLALDWELPFELMCDASNLALVGVLGQQVGKHSHVIAYASRILDSAQSNYITTKKKLLAIFFALDKFRSYFLSSKIIVFSNHATLKFLLKKPDAKPRLIH